MGKNKQPLNYLDFVEQEAKGLNTAAYLHYVTLLTELAINSITWDGLPAEIDMRFMEMTISERGHALFFKDENLQFDKQHICLPCTMTGLFNVYGIPIDRRAYSVNGDHWDRTENDSVVIFNNRLRRSDLPVIRYYARKLAECERTIEVNIRGQKTPKVITCEQSNLLSLENALKKYDGNTPVIAATKNLLADGRDTPVLYDLTVPYKAGDLQLYKRQLFSDALSYFGIENLQSEKKERQISDEIQTSMGYIEMRRYVRLNTRMEAAQKINSMFGLNVQPKFNNFVLGDMVMNDASEVSEDVEIYDNDTADM